MNIKPLFDNIVIKPLESTEETVGGIVLPDIAKEKPQIGEVVAVGPGKILEDTTKITSTDVGDVVSHMSTMVVEVGQKVMYRKWGGNEIKMNGKDYLIVEQKDILAIVE